MKIATVKCDETIRLARERARSLRRRLRAEEKNIAALEIEAEKRLRRRGVSIPDPVLAIRPRQIWTGKGSRRVRICILRVERGFAVVAGPRSNREKKLSLERIRLAYDLMLDVPDAPRLESPIPTASSAERARTRS